MTSQQVREMKSNGIQDEEIQRMKQEIEELKQQIDDVVEVGDTCRENEQTCVENSDRHIKDNLKENINITSSSYNSKSENQQLLEFDQGTSVTSQHDYYDDDIRELTEYWYLNKKTRCYGHHHQYRLHNFKGCVQDLIDHYQFDRQKSIEILKICMELHSDTPDTPNWYIKHHKGLEYLNMAISRVVKNTSVPTSDNESSRRIHEYLRTYILPLHKAGKVFTEKSILDRLKSRLGRDLEMMGEDAVLDLVEQVLGNVN